MERKTYEGIGDAANAVREYYLEHQGAFPDHVRERVLPATRTGTSPVDMLVHFAEAVYANRDDVPAEAKAIAAGVAGLAALEGYHDQLHGRAARMVNILRRDSGEEAPARGWPKPENDVEVREGYGPPAEPEAVEPGPPLPPPTE